LLLADVPANNTKIDVVLQHYTGRAADYAGNKTGAASFIDFIVKEVRGI